MRTPHGTFGLARSVAHEVLHLSGPAQAGIALCSITIVLGMTTIGAGSILGMGAMMALLAGSTQETNKALEVRKAQRELITVAIMCEAISAVVGTFIVDFEPVGTMEPSEAVGTALIGGVLWSTCFFAVRGVATRWTLGLSYRLAMGVESEAATRRARARAEVSGESARIIAALVLWAAWWPSFVWMLSAMAGADRELRMCASAASTGVGLGLVLALACRESDPGAGARDQDTGGRAAGMNAHQNAVQRGRRMHAERWRAEARRPDANEDREARLTELEAQWEAQREQAMRWRAMPTHPVLWHGDDGRCAWDVLSENAQTKIAPWLMVIDTQWVPAHMMVRALEERGAHGAEVEAALDERTTQVGPRMVAVELKPELGPSGDGTICGVGRWLRKHRAKIDAWRWLELCAGHNGRRWSAKAIEGCTMARGDEARCASSALAGGENDEQGCMPWLHGWPAQLAKKNGCATLGQCGSGLCNQAPRRRRDAARAR